MKMRLKVSKQLSKQEIENYVSFLKADSKTLFYQYPSFHKILEKNLGSIAYYFTWYDEKGMIAVFPILLKKNKMLGAVANSLPFYGSNGGVVFRPGLSPESRDLVRNILKKEIETFYRNEGVLLSTIIVSPFDKESCIWFNHNWRVDFKDHRIGQITELPEYSDSIEDELMTLFDSPRPRNIRRAMKANVITDIEHGRESLEFLFQVHKSNIESIGGLPKSKQFFLDIPDFFDESEYCVFVAKKEGKCIAAILLFFFNRTVEYFTPATVHEHRKDQPSALLIFEAMKHASKRGFKYWNWGGTWETQTGVYDFKKRWGAEDYRYEYFIQIIDPDVKNIELVELKEAFPNFYLYPY